MGQRQFTDKEGYNHTLVYGNDIDVRLEYLRQQIRNENISYGEIAELQSLVDYIPEGDVLLLEWAGVPENV